MFLVFTAVPESPLKNRAIAINVEDIVSIVSPTIEGSNFPGYSEIKLKSNVLVNTENNEEVLTYIWVYGEVPSIREQVNTMLSDIRMGRI